MVGLLPSGPFQINYDICFVRSNVDCRGQPWYRLTQKLSYGPAHMGLASTRELLFSMTWPTNTPEVLMSPVMFAKPAWLDCIFKFAQAFYSCFGLCVEHLAV